METPIEAARRLSPDTQDEIARAILEMAGADAGPEAIESEHLSAVLEGLAQAEGGELATDTEFGAAFRRFDP